MNNNYGMNMDPVSQNSLQKWNVPEKHILMLVQTGRSPDANMPGYCKGSTWIQKYILYITELFSVK